MWPGLNASYFSNMVPVRWKPSMLERSQRRASSFASVLASARSSACTRIHCKGGHAAGLSHCWPVTRFDVTTPPSCQSPEVCTSALAARYAMSGTVPFTSDPAQPAQRGKNAAGVTAVAGLSAPASRSKSAHHARDSFQRAALIDEHSCVARASYCDAVVPEPAAPPTRSRRAAARSCITTMELRSAGTMEEVRAVVMSLPPAPSQRELKSQPLSAADAMLPHSERAACEPGGAPACFAVAMSSRHDSGRGPETATLYR
mmetsp:Transcript_25447/g.95909  ORF Transcript_25447/g.95909 Transcript_25447/m.95909 type:complete len:259 (-) Transcript_25447:1027-1803(-)